MGKKIDGDELVQYITERFIRYMETPRNVRRLKRQEMKSHRESWTTLWFGLLPFSLGLWFSASKSKIRKASRLRLARRKETPRGMKS